MTGTKERILDASSVLFRRQGLTGTGIKQVLDLADVPFGSLYHHFPGGKDQLAAETIRRAGEHYGRVVAEKLLGQDDLVSGFEAAFRDAGATLEATDYADACPIETVALEVASTNPALRAATAEVFDSWLAGLCALLVAEGLDAATARALALTILSSLEGAFILARTARSTEALEACGVAMATLLRTALAEARR